MVNHLRNCAHLILFHALFIFDQTLSGRFNRKSSFVFNTVGDRMVSMWHLDQPAGKQCMLLILFRENANIKSENIGNYPRLKLFQCFPHHPPNLSCHCHQNHTHCLAAGMSCSLKPFSIFTFVAFVCPSTGSSFYEQISGQCKR